MTLRVVVCDRRPIVENGIHTILSSMGEIDIHKSSGSGRAAIAAAEANQPDVVITGFQLTDVTREEFIEKMRNIGDGIPILGYAIGEGDAALADMARSGIDGLLSEDASEMELVLAIRAVAAGQAMFGPRIARQILDWIQRHDEHTQVDPQLLTRSLTSREQEVLVMTAQGMSIEDIARRLYIGPATVRTHLYRLRCKLKLRDRAQLVSFAYRAGMMQRVPVGATKLAAGRI
jgi:DNA-binding NarL/FixJ family response regulator